MLYNGKGSFCFLTMQEVLSCPPRKSQNRRKIIPSSPGATAVVLLIHGRLFAFTLVSVTSTYGADGRGDGSSSCRGSGLLQQRGSLHAFHFLAQSNASAEPLAVQGAAWTFYHPCRTRTPRVWGSSEHDKILESRKERRG